MRSACLVLVAALAALVTPRARADDFCATCELQLGMGTAFHFWGYNNSLVIPAAFNFDQDRWELAVFRFPSTQHFWVPVFVYDVQWAKPYWAASFTRRLELFRYEHWRLFLGLGAAYKTQENRQIASLWNFSEQGGLRLRPTRGYTIELAYRHFSNAGLKKPNHGQDFATLTFSVYPALFRHHGSPP
jgi:Lipid A 3-O-deacylase (PagL)